MEYGHTLIAALAISLGLGAPVALVGLLLWYKSRKTRLIHETALRLAEEASRFRRNCLWAKRSLFPICAAASC